MCVGYVLVCAETGKLDERRTDYGMCVCVCVSARLVRWGEQHGEELLLSPRKKREEGGR